jgi:DNA-binding MarR family transcriptional regulator
MSMDLESPHAQLIMDSLRRIVQALRRSSLSLEKLTGLTGAQVFVLRQIQSKSGLSLNELAGLTFTHQSTMSEVVSRLERMGLVVRSKSADDARRLEIRLTVEGQAVVVAGNLPAQENLIRAIAALPRKTAAHLAEGLDLLIKTAGLSDQPAVLFFDEAEGSTRSNEPGK